MKKKSLFSLFSLGLLLFSSSALAQNIKVNVYDENLLPVEDTTYVTSNDVFSKATPNKVNGKDKLYKVYKGQTIDFKLRKDIGNQQIGVIIPENNQYLDNGNTGFIFDSKYDVLGVSASTDKEIALVQKAVGDVTKDTYLPAPIVSRTANSVTVDIDLKPFNKGIIEGKTNITSFRYQVEATNINTKAKVTVTKTTPKFSLKLAAKGEYQIRYKVQFLNSKGQVYTTTKSYSPYTKVLVGYGLDAVSQYSALQAPLAAPDIANTKKYEYIEVPKAGTIIYKGSTAKDLKVKYVYQIYSLINKKVFKTYTKDTNTLLFPEEKNGTYTVRYRLDIYKGSTKKASTLWSPETYFTIGYNGAVHYKTRPEAVEVNLKSLKTKTNEQNNNGQSYYTFDNSIGIELQYPAVRSLLGKTYKFVPYASNIKSMTCQYNLQKDSGVAKSYIAASCGSIPQAMADYIFSNPGNYSLKYRFYFKTTTGKVYGDAWSPVTKFSALEAKSGYSLLGEWTPMCGFASGIFQDRLTLFDLTQLVNNGCENYTNN